MPTIKQIKEKHEMQLMSIDGVEGVGIGEDRGQPIIQVYVVRKTRRLKAQIPDELGGYPVQIESTGGEFHTLPA
ncbi:MAG: hypothetical protein M3437_08040 [Chloroflexota bacterium]|nr:hypothetical protein [Chloroflexota bacterium]MDQ5864427.1 hypothetical protein [Chloroflexota bacterium]